MESLKQKIWDFLSISQAEAFRRVLTFYTNMIELRHIVKKKKGQASISKVVPLECTKIYINIFLSFFLPLTYFA